MQSKEDLVLRGFNFSDCKTSHFVLATYRYKIHLNFTEIPSLALDLLSLDI